MENLGFVKALPEQHSVVSLVDEVMPIKPVASVEFYQADSGIHTVTDSAPEYVDSAPVIKARLAVAGLKRTNELARQGISDTWNSNVMTAARNDGFGDTKSRIIGNSTLLAASLIGYGFEIGPGNEWAVAKVGRETMQKVAEEGDVKLSAVSVGAALGVLSMVEHTALGLLMYRNMRRFPSVVDVWRNSKFGQSKVPKNSRNRNVFARFFNAFTIGASTVNIEDSMTDPDFMSEHKGVKRTLSSAKLIAIGSMTIGAAAGGGIQHAMNEGNKVRADQILDIASSPWPWTGLFVATRAFEYLKKRNTKPEREVTKLPAHIKEKITAPVAWGAMGLFAAASMIDMQVPKSRAADTVVRSIVGRLNRKGSLNIPQ